MTEKGMDLNCPHCVREELYKEQIQTMKALLKQQERIIDTIDRNYMTWLFELGVIAPDEIVSINNQIKELYERRRHDKGLLTELSI